MDKFLYRAVTPFPRIAQSACTFQCRAGVFNRTPWWERCQPVDIINIQLITDVRLSELFNRFTPLIIHSYLYTYRCLGNRHIARFIAPVDCQARLSGHDGDPRVTVAELWPEYSSTQHALRGSDRKCHICERLPQTLVTTLTKQLTHQVTTRAEQWFDQRWSQPF